MVSVRLADADDIAALSAALAQAFSDDPLMNWLLPQRTRRDARRKLVFRLELQTYVLPQDGMVFTADDDGGGGRVVGGCLVLPPGRWRPPNAVDGRTAMQWLGAFGRQFRRAIRTQQALQTHHPTQPHYYVRSVGVRPAWQGQGLGSALMRPTLDRCDADGVSAYLEASSERSAALYERLGFFHLGALELPDGGPPLWPMQRLPGG